MHRYRRRREAHVVLLLRVGRAQLALMRLCSAVKRSVCARLYLELAAAPLFSVGPLLTLVHDQYGILIS